MYTTGYAKAKDETNLSKVSADFFRVNVQIYIRRDKKGVEKGKVRSINNSVNGRR